MRREKNKEQSASMIVTMWRNNDISALPVWKEDVKHKVTCMDEN
jgi:hypothetical protein